MGRQFKGGKIMEIGFVVLGFGLLTGSSLCLIIGCLVMLSNRDNF